MALDPTLNQPDFSLLPWGSCPPVALLCGLETIDEKHRLTVGAQSLEAIDCVGVRSLPCLGISKGF